MTSRTRTAAAARRTAVLAIASTLALGGCRDVEGPTGLPTDLTAVKSEAPAAPFGVMTRNLYIGGSTAPLLSLDFGDLPAVLAATNAFWADVQASDIPARTAVLADEIVRLRPEVVGLQEAVGFVVLDGSFTPVAQLDILQRLVAEIDARGGGYDLVAVQENTSSALPLSVSATGVDRWLQFTDRIAMLVREDVEMDGPAESDNYAATFVAGPVELKRGWIRARVEHGGVDWTVVTTHLEVQALAPIQALQAGELLSSIVPADDNSILMGDLNSDAEAGPGAPSWTPTYQTLLDAGFVDAWEQAHPGARPVGYTCCHADDLRNPSASFDERIDFVLMRSPQGIGSDWRLNGSVHADIVGDEAGDRTSGDLWPSDHGGLVAEIRLAPGVFANR